MLRRLPRDEKRSGGTRASEIGSASGHVLRYDCIRGGKDIRIDTLVSSYDTDYHR